jgi:hypothetical protein
MLFLATKAWILSSQRFKYGSNKAPKINNEKAAKTIKKRDSFSHPLKWKKREKQKSTPPSANQAY